MINRRNFFNQKAKSNLITYDKFRKIATGQGDDCTTECLLDYSYFKKCYKLTPTVLGKQKKLGVEPKAMQQINCMLLSCQVRVSECIHTL